MKVLFLLITAYYRMTKLEEGDLHLVMRLAIGSYIEKYIV